MTSKSYAESLGWIEIDTDYGKRWYKDFGIMRMIVWKKDAMKSHEKYIKDFYKKNEADTEPKGE